ncbi:MAG: hypothetical protein WBG71_10380 [Leeuwenhoekiella sp.]
MKAKIINTKILLIALMAIFSVSCTEDEGEPEISFDPITLEFKELGLDYDDTQFSIDGYNFVAYFVQSADNLQYTPAPGIGLWNSTAGNGPANIQLDLNQFSGLNAITIDYEDYSNLMVSLYKNGSLVKETDHERNGTIERSLKVDIDDQYDAIKLSSYEAIILTMHFE